MADVSRFQVDDATLDWTFQDVSGGSDISDGYC